MALTRLYMPTLGKYNRILFLLYFALYYCKCLIKKYYTKNRKYFNVSIFLFSFHDVNGPYSQCCYTRVKLGQSHYLVLKTRICHNYQKESYKRGLQQLPIPHPTKVVSFHIIQLLVLYTTWIPTDHFQGDNTITHRPKSQIHPFH